MIYLFAGDDSKRKILNYEKFMDSVKKNLEVFVFNKNDFNRDSIESFYSGSSLFFTSCIVVLKDLLDKEETRDFLLDKLDLMSQSENHFVFLESKLSKPTLDEFKKVRAELNIFELTKDQKEKFNNFLVAYAFEAGDKVNCWLNFRMAMDKGVMIDEISGVLFWKIKDMILKKNFRKFKEQKLENLAQELSYLLPRARSEGKDAEVVFEKFIIEAF